MSTEAKKDTSSFEEFKENFWREFQGWNFNFGCIVTYDVDLDDRVLRRIRDKYLNRDDYPSLNELKQIIIFKSAEDKVRWGTDLTGYSKDFNNDLKRGIKTALELARFDLGHVKPKIHQEEETAEAAPVQKEPSPQKKTLRVYEAAEKADDPRTANPLNLYHYNNPLNPANKYQFDNDYNPINRFKFDNPLNPANRYNPNNLLNPINRFDSDSPLNPINKFRSSEDPPRRERSDPFDLWKDDSFDFDLDLDLDLDLDP